MLVSSHNGVKQKEIVLQPSKVVTFGQEDVPEGESKRKYVSKAHSTVLLTKSGFGEDWEATLTNASGNGTVYLPAGGKQVYLRGKGTSRDLRFGDSFALCATQPELFTVQFIAPPFWLSAHGAHPAPDVVTGASPNGKTPVPGLFKFDEAISEEVEKRLFDHESLFAANNVPSGQPGSVAEILSRKAREVSNGKVGATASSDGQVLTNKRLVELARGQVYPPELVKSLEWVREKLGMQNVIMFPDDLHALTYYPNEGQGITPHVDSYWRWGLTVVGFSLGAPATLVMTCLESDRVVVKVALPRRSIYVFSGAARKLWDHHIEDVGWGGYPDARPRRSITLRCSRTWERMELDRKIKAETDEATKAALKRSLTAHGPDMDELLESKESPLGGRLMYWKHAEMQPNEGLGEGYGWRFSEDELVKKRGKAAELRQWLDANWPGGDERW
jgi:hypothetical protein